MPRHLTAASHGIRFDVAKPLVMMEIGKNNGNYPVFTTEYVKNHGELHVHGSDETGFPIFTFACVSGEDPYYALNKSMLKSVANAYTFNEDRTRTSQENNILLHATHVMTALGVYYTSLGNRWARSWGINAGDLMANMDPDTFEMRGFTLTSVRQLESMSEEEWVAHILSHEEPVGKGREAFHPFAIYGEEYVSKVLASAKIIAAGRG